MEKQKINQEDHVLFIINDNIIHGDTRFQKYGFLLFMQYKKELAELNINYDGFSFYDDWKAYHYGPYSEKLTRDINECIEKKLLQKTKSLHSNKPYELYALTLKGRARWRGFLSYTHEEMIKINKKIQELQSVHFYKLLRQIYNAYPDYTIHSKIKHTLN